MNKKRFQILLLVITLLLAGAVAYAQEICPLTNAPMDPVGIKSFSQFKKIAILENGRIKPLDSFARNLLLRFSGRTNLHKEPAVSWLARLLFAPETTIQDKVFLINHPDIPNALGIEVDPQRRYNYSQLEPSLDKLRDLAEAANQIDSKKRDIVESELMRVYDNVHMYVLLSFNLSFLMPHSDFSVSNPEILKALNLSPKQKVYSFFDIATQAQALQSMIGALEKVPEDQWTVNQKISLNLIHNLYNWSSIYHDLPLAIIPPFEGGEGWLSPWDTMTTALQSESGREDLGLLKQMYDSYWFGRQLEFDLSVKKLRDSVEKRASAKDRQALQLTGLEIIFNNLNLFLWAKILYLLALLLSLILIIRSNATALKFNFAIIVAAFVLHLTGLLMRITILQRPPVSNLYETFIFVSFISVLCSILIERINKKGLGNLVAGICGYVFLTIAGKFGMEGDTLQVLVAVLNSNFWLGTHVISITVGYAGVCVAGVIGHIYVLQSVFRSKDKELLESTQKFLIGTLAFGLAMTFLGTNLGGIWADQSWGRFWGWDPKENGALMIVLWTSILFHAKIAKLIGPLGMAVGSVLGVIVVMWAWFGVNLLSIGLHSYGFTSGLAYNLLIYLICQLLFLIVFTPIAHRNMRS